MQKNNSIIQEKLIRYTSEMVAVTRLEKDGWREGREEEGGGGGGTREHEENFLQERARAYASLDRVDVLTRCTNNNVKTLRPQWCKASNVKRSHNIMNIT